MTNLKHLGYTFQDTQTVSSYIRSLMKSPVFDRLSECPINFKNNFNILAVRRAC